MRTYWNLLLLLPVVGALDVPFYARRAPELSGVPFFIWYQFVLVVFGAAITGLVHFLQNRGTQEPEDPAPDGAGEMTAATDGRAGA